jgi:hypothetical protein
MKRFMGKVWVLGLFAFISQMAAAHGTPTKDDRSEGESLTLLAHFDHSPDLLLWKHLVRDFMGTVTPGGRIHELVLETSEIAGREFANLIVVHMIGTCQPLRTRGTAWRPQPLGWVREVDGIFLPFVFVDCDRVAEVASRVGAGVVSEQEYAAALAKVIRHELRHILLNTATHEREGEHKASLSAGDLIRREHGTHQSSSGVWFQHWSINKAFTALKQQER